MKILIALTYYRPHTSGLTIYVERLARALADRGHTVTVLTSRYDRSLPREEHLHGVNVIRAPVAFRVSKGVIMPTIGLIATKLVRAHDVLSLHLPQFDASGIALRGRLMKKPAVLTYHSDLTLPPGLFNRLADKAVHVSNIVAARLSDTLVSYTQDFATHSPFLSRYLDKVRVIPPPIHVHTPVQAEIDAFRARWNPDGLRVIGMATRLAAEKGVEYLLSALPRVREVFPNIRVLFAGQHQAVLGEEAYARRLAPLIEREGDRWTFLGVLDQVHIASFFSNLDVLVVPSINSTETFGLVQVEAMMLGTPSIASDLPGVRQPVRMTGMGEVVPVRDGAALAEAIIRVLHDRERYLRLRADIEALFSTERTAERYEQVFEELLAALGHHSVNAPAQRSLVDD
ncbi:MAG TPA: glycosyltransferase family 4 protein [Anaerolineae bacterium]|nr:glycosyltransferase family 4 protein [Anaerolineae bacterium]